MIANSSDNELLAFLYKEITEYFMFKI